MTLLTQTLSFANMRLAWDEVAENKGIAGVDNVTIPAWQRNWEERVQQLTLAVRTNRYRPGRLRQRRVPKANRRESRLLRIPTVTDRVLQRAMLQILSPIYEPLFLPCSFGYRPGIGLKEAVHQINHLRRQEYHWVLDADIDDFFNHIDHILLFDFLNQDLADDSLFPLLRQWLKIGRTVPTRPVGIPMGSPISPLLANVYLHRLDQSLTAQHYPLVRYADDFIVLSHSQERAKQSYQAVVEILTSLKLGFEPAKTRLTTFEAGFDFLGVHFEENCYWYTWGDKRIEVGNDQEDWLFGRFGPDYD